MSTTTTYWIDDREGEGLSADTSHPAFVAHFTEPFYYDCVDELAPFGSDEGADVLWQLEDRYQEGEGATDVLDWLFALLDAHGFEYASRDVALAKDPAVFEQVARTSPFFLENLDQTIASAAFAQIKITGAVDPRLKQLALAALQRRIERFKGEADVEERLGLLASDLRGFQ